MKSFIFVLMFVVPGLGFAKDRCTDQDRAELLQIIDAAVKATRFVKPGDADLILLEAASYQACFRKYDQAKKLASTIRDKKYRSYAFYSIALNYVRHGHPARGIPLADSTIRKSEVLEDIAICQAERGDFDGALKTISLITEDLVVSEDWIIKADWIKGYGLLKVAILQAKAGNQNASLKMIDQAKSILKNHDDLDVIGKFAEAYAYAGDLEAGSHWLKLLKKEYNATLPFMLTDVALGYASAKHNEMALQIIKEHPNRDSIGQEIYEIGLFLLSRGEEEIVQKLLSISDWTPERDDLRFELAKWNIKQQQPEKALKYVDQFDEISTELRARALLNIAVLQQTLKQPLEADKNVQQVKALIEDARSDPHLFALLLVEWANYQVQQKNRKAAQSSLHDALEAAKKLNYSNHSGSGFHHPLQVIFRGQVQAGDIAGANETLEFTQKMLPQIKKSNQGFPVFTANLKPEIARCYIEIDDLKTALKIANEAELNSLIFTRIGETLGRKGDLMAALKWCEQSVPGPMKAQVLISVARGAIEAKECDCDDPIQRLWNNASGFF